MAEVAEKESTELVAVPPREKALDVFVSEKGLEPYLQTIRQQLDQFLAAPPSLDTKKGRDAYASMAFKIARSKTALDTVGKELVADLKEKPKMVDASRKRCRDTLDAWRDEARGPLNEWEAKEDARKAAHEDRIDWLRNRDDLLDELASDQIAERINEAELVAIGEQWEEYEAEAARTKDAVLAKLRAGLSRRQKYEAEQAELERLRQQEAEREQKEREAQIAREAEERARREAEQAAQAEREAVARREQEAKAEAERKEREYQEGIAKAQREAEAERQRIQQEHERQEQARLDAERREREEAERRQANKEHRKRINRAAMQAMIDGGMPENCAKQAITLIAQSKVPNITINY